MLSIVVPVYNEEENLPELCDRLTAVLDGVGEPYEVILVDDGSRDGSLAWIAQWCESQASFRCISLARNFGHQAAVTAGIDLAQGDGVIVMDGDLQDPPEALPKFIAKWREGYDVVYAIRRQRKENVLKRLAYALFYRVLRRLSYLDIPLDSGDFCLMGRRVVRVLQHLPERNRFVRGLRTWVGLRQIGVEYERSARAAGKPKYTFAKLLKLALDGLISFSVLPLRMIGGLGLVSAGLGVLWACVILVQRLLGAFDVPGYTTVMIAVLVLGGIQLVCLGVIGEYLGQIYDEVKQRPRYLVGSLIGFGHCANQPEPVELLAAERAFHR